MSRIGNKPIPIPQKVEVTVADQVVSVKGPLGQLEWRVAKGIAVAVTDGQVQVSRASDDRHLRALHGLVRAELNNLVVGVSNGASALLPPEKKQPRTIKSGLVWRALTKT